MVNFEREFQKTWKQDTPKLAYTSQICNLYKCLIEILNCVLPPSVRLFWQSDSTISSDMLVSMQYTVRVIGEAKTFTLPIYCAEYERVGSLIALGMAAVDSTFESTLHDGESFIDDYKKYDDFSSVRWDDPKSRASKRGYGLRNANAALRRAALSKPLEDYFETLRDECTSGIIGRLACVSAIGIGDGCSHSMALISRRKEDFDGTWSNLKYIVGEDDEEYNASPALCEAEGMSGNISKFYRLFQLLERRNKDDTMKPSLMFSDYMHINDDESFAFRVVRGLMNLVSMNIVVMYYLKGFCPDDGLDEDHNDVHEYIKCLTSALGDKFKEDYSDIFPGDNTDNDPSGNHSLDRDNGLVYRYILKSKARFQTKFMEWLRMQNSSKWILAEEPLGPFPEEYKDIKPDSSGRRTIRDEDGSFRYLIDISTESILAIYNELEAHHRIANNHHEARVAPRFLNFGFYSYKNIGVPLYRFCIHVEGIYGDRDSEWEEDPDLDTSPVTELVNTLSTKYNITLWDVQPEDVIVRDEEAFAINFSKVKFTEESSDDYSDTDEWYVGQTRKLIKTIALWDTEEVSKGDNHTRK